MNDIMKKLDEQKLNPADLVSLKNIIDVASKRGAFRASEMTAIGKVYDKLDFATKVVENEKQLLTEKGENVFAGFEEDIENIMKTVLQIEYHNNGREWRTKESFIESAPF